MMTHTGQSMRTHILVQKSIIISRKWIAVYGRGGRNTSQPYDQSAAIYEKFKTHCSSIMGVGILHNNVPSKFNSPKEATFA